MKFKVLGAVLAAGAAAGAVCLLRQRKHPEQESVTTAEALLTPQVQADLAAKISAFAPENGFAMLLSDDRGNLSRSLAAHCRMLFSADGSGAAAEERAYFPDNIIRAACDPTRLWLAENSLDMAVLVNVLQRYAAPEMVLAELERVLGPDGILILPTTVRTAAFSESAWLSTMELLGVPAQHAWTQEELRALLEGNGWKLLCEETLGGSFPMVVFCCQRA